jgi:CRP/FNR family cyclic AMP-dependent transcriptional regulator
MVDFSQSDEGGTFLRAGTILFAEGELATDLYIIKSGEIRIVKEKEKKLIPISILKEGDFIGELSLFSMEKRSASAIVIKDSEVMIIDKADIQKAVNECPEWVTDIMVTLGDRLRDSTTMLREHNIIDDILTEGNPFTPNEEIGFIKGISNYRNENNL